MTNFALNRQLVDLATRMAKLEDAVTRLEEAMRQFRDASVRGRKPQWMKTLEGAPDNDARTTAL